MPGKDYPRKTSPILTYRNFIHCGVLSCKVTCSVENSLFCLVCQKWSHYKCLKLTQTSFFESINNNNFVCSTRCYGNLLPFVKLNLTDFLSTTIIVPGEEKYPCKKCHKECFGNELMDCIQCETCLKWLHRDCAKLLYTFDSYIDNDLSFFCSPNCEHRQRAKIFPFYNVTNSKKVDEFHPRKDNYPCKICHLQCVTDCIQCDLCQYWLHANCAKLTIEELEALSDSARTYICSFQCEIRELPLYSNNDYFIDDQFNSLSLSYNNYPVFRPDFQNINNDDIASTKISARNISSSSFTLQDKITKAKKSKSVYFDQFLDSRCAFLKPNELNDSYLNVPKSNDLVIFHNNIRSLNKNFHKVEEVFQNCTNFPDIMAFTDTRRNDEFTIPKLKGYKFEFVNSSTKAGGVGVYLADSLNYNLCPDLNFLNNMNYCEDIWLKLHIDNPILGGNSIHKEELIIGVVYRHDFKSNYDEFCDRFCEQLIRLHQKKMKYYIVGDFNINLLKYNLAANVTKYLDAISSTGCNVLIDRATRVPKHGNPSCLDHVYTNLPSQKLDNHVIMADITDHFGTLSKIEGVLKKSDAPEIYFRNSNLSDSQWQEFNSELECSLGRNIPFQHLLNSNYLAKYITSTYQDVIEKFMPLKKLSKKETEHFDKPWITSGFKVSIAKKMIYFIYGQKLNISMTIKSTNHIATF